MSAYYTKLKVIWEELSDFRPVLNCNCGGAQLLIDHLENEYVLAFLMGLNDSYTSIRGQILVMDPMPHITRVFSLVSQEEKQRKVGNSTATLESQLACVVQSSNNNNKKQKNGKKDRPICSHCGLEGHIKDKCFKIHGYPLAIRRGNKILQWQTKFLIKLKAAQAMLL